MRHGQLQEIRLRDFRCFGEPQTARLAPLTLLVGENSTGKTSFLAAVQAVWDAAHGSGAPDFRKAPFDLGAFPEIVHSRTGRTNGPSSFAIGFTEQFLEDRLLDFEVTFESRDAAPSPAATEWREGATFVGFRRPHEESAQCVFESQSGSWCCRLTDDDQMTEGPWIVGFFSRFFHAVADDDPMSLADDLEPSPLTRDRVPSPEDLAKFSFLLGLTIQYPSQEGPFASAPIHPSPVRTYDPTKLSSDPWGADVPSRFANLQFQHKSEWAGLKEKLDAFGRESGLFDDFSVKQLTGVEGGPFQLQVRKFGKRGRKGPKRNLMDVGFGISQVLPVLAALFGADGPPLFLLQQPELHLHPSAQAALGSLFCRTAEADRQLIIETHSEYIIDRVRMDIRDRETALRPDDVSILFFERCDHDVRIHSLQFDDQGNVLGAPEGYGQFFMDETRRSVGL